MKRILQLLITLLLLTGLASGGYWFYQQRTQTNNTSQSTQVTQTVTVTKGDLSASLTLVGQLDAPQNTDLAFDQLSSATNLLSLAVVAGDVVTSGQVLASIDPALFEQALEEAQATLQQAEKSLQELLEPPSELEFAQAEAAVSKAELDLKQALKHLVELQQPIDLSELQVAVQNAQDDLALARLRQQLAEHDSSAKSQRDLQYAVDWNQRHYWELKDLVATGKANLEQKEELAAAEQTLDELGIDLIYAQSQWTVAQQSAAATVTNAQLALSEAQQAISDAQRGVDELEVAKANVAIQKATVAAQKAWDAQNELQAGVDAEELAAAQIDIKEAEQAVAAAENSLFATALRAPFAGTILEVPTAEGDRITSNSTILTLANLKELQVVVSVDETTIRQVEKGQAVEIAFDAFPGETFQGEVLSVPLQGTLQGGVMVYEVTTSLEGTKELPLLMGMTANVEIKVGEVKNVLLIPKMALLAINGGYQVLIANRSDPAGVAQSVPVEIGLSDGIYSEIRSGLQAGDTVIIQSSTSASTQFGFPGGGLLGGPPGPPSGGNNNGRSNRRSGG